MSANSAEFYHQLPIQKMALSALLLNEESFLKVPDDWHVIITDIKGSTHAVMKGLNETVNFIATGSIVSVLNLAFRADISIPFFFGGDGATFVVPSSILDAALQSLSLYKQNTLKNFDMELRVGTVPVREIYEAGYNIRLSKFQVSEFFTIPVALGEGLNYAEKLIKAEDYMLNGTTGLAKELDLSGMQCRWDKIGPPENSQEVVTLLVVAQDPKVQAQVFSEVIRNLDQIFGTAQKRQPISVAKLKLNTTFNRLNAEMRNRVGETRFFELLKTWLINLYGYIYFRTEHGKNYLNRLVKMSDTLVLDGKINTVISGTGSQREALVKVLDQMEKDGKILYGIYISNSAVMSCYVRDLEDGHIHFVDGSEGGYTQAAGMVKRKIAVG